MLADVVTKLVQLEADMEVVNRAAVAIDLADEMDRSPADVIILSCEETDLPQVGGDLLRHSPLVRVLALTSDSHSAFLYELTPRALPLGELTPQTLVQVIRGAAGGVGGVKHDP